LAEVVKSADHGFELSYSHVVPGAPDEVMKGFAKVDSWWDADHTYSGNAGNLSLDLKAGGCFCERLQNGGGVEHMRVAHVDPGKRLVLTGGLGPLLHQATAAVMDVQFAPAGDGTRVTVNYKAAGFANGGAAAMAPLVDKVLANQLMRLTVYVTPPVPLR
jgi:uncharacterized protein YndB with AHSA1/START domain